MELSNIIFTIFLLLISFFFNKYILIVVSKVKYNVLRDDDSCDNDFNDAIFYITASAYEEINTNNFVSKKIFNFNDFFF